MNELSGVICDLSETIEILIANDQQLSSEYKITKKEYIKHKQEFIRISEAIHQLFNRCVTDDSITREWQNLTREINGPFNNRSNFRAKHLVERLRDSWQHLLRDRATRSLTYNDEQFHALEKIKIGETGKRIKALLCDEVRLAINYQAEALADWYKMAQTLYLQTQILQKDVMTYEESLLDIKDKLVQMKEDAKTNGTNINMANNNHTNNILNGDTNGCRVDLKLIMNYQREIAALMRQNSELIDMIQNLNFDELDEVQQSLPLDNTRL